MRKLNCLLIALAIFAVACENSFDEQSKNQITLSSKTIEVHFESNEHTINVTSPYSWMAESKNDWISLTCDNGIAGTEELRFVCDRNLDELERKGTIVIKNEDFGLATELYVIQKAFMPELVVEQDKTLSFTEKGGSDIIKVSSNFNYSVSDNASWISCDKVEEGVKVTASASDVANERTAQVTIYSEKYNLIYEVEIIQQAFELELSIDKEELYFDADGGSEILNITTNAEFSITETADWITCEKSGNSVEITAYASTVVEERYADVIISSDKYNVSKVVTVRQCAFEPYISISTTELIVEAKGGEQNVTISTNCQYDYSANVDWIKFHKEGSYPDVLPNYNGLFPIYISPNYKTETRSGEITIYNTKYDISKTIQVRQYGTPNGFLSIAGLAIDCTDESSNVLNYKCTIIDESGGYIQSFKYGERPIEPIELEPGNYILKIQSGDIPNTAWDTPIYGGEKAFKIVSGETIIFSDITCMLMQIKVTITYAADLWERLGENTRTIVSVGENELEYSLTETRAGFFATEQNSNVTFHISGTYADDMVNYRPIDITKELLDRSIGDEIKVHLYISSTTEGTTITGNVTIMRCNGSGSR